MIRSNQTVLFCFIFTSFLLLHPGVAKCEKIILDKILIDENELLVDFTIDNIIDASLATILDENFRINLVIDIALVTAGRKLLNRPVSEKTIAMFMEHDLWLKRYLLEKQDTGKKEIYATIEHLNRRVSSSYRVRLPGVNNLNPEDSYYILLSININPVTTGTFREIIGWFVPRDSLDRQKTGIDSGIARVMLGVFKQAFNLEDIRFRKRSDPFKLADLPAR